MFRLTMLSFYASVLVLLIHYSAASTSRFQAHSAWKTFQSRDEEPAANAATAMGADDFASASDDVSSSDDQDLFLGTSSSLSSSFSSDQAMLQNRANQASHARAFPDDDEDWIVEKKQKPRFLGCYALDSSMPNQILREGGANGAFFQLSLKHAVIQKKKYFAMARYDRTGWLNMFDQLKNEVFAGHDTGCFRPCLDAIDKFCGCADQFCTENGAAKVSGQEHVRRWAVYELE